MSPYPSHMIMLLTDKRVRTPRVDMRAHDVALSRRDQRDVVAPLAPLFLSVNTPSSSFSPRTIDTGDSPYYGTLYTCHFHDVSFSRYSTH